ncbi:reticulocyte-binding protein homolog 2a [Lucilia cuprina]|uniref:reticulocyte-binding protein homolog 2a n=1 Tax=Lucilia cuprina TaxID=7375 RepID=UPI001F06D4AF|nr:reticulocyte-binding protein homolog 2a [Lucilia cuprina]
MRYLEWLVQLCFMWHVMKIIKTHGELLSKETIFQLQKYPAVNRTDEEDDGESNVIKNIPKICYDNNAHDKTATQTTYSSGSNNTVELLYIFKTILQQLHKSECEQIERKEVQRRATKGDFQPREEEQPASRYETFNILQQLKLDEQKQKWQEQQLEKQQQLKLHLQQQQNALKLQQIMQHLDAESLGKAGKKKKKKKKKKKRKKRKKKPKDKKKKRKKKKQKPTHQTSLLAHPAHILYASPTQKPHYYHDHHYYDQHVTTTTKKPYLHHPLVPIKKIKYILRKNTIFKKKKKEYLNHLKHVLYPFVKFIAFFTIINPFTLAVFLFSLISPVVFGFLGFIGLSFLIKPALHLLFGVKQTVNTIKRQKLQQLRKRQRLRDSRRPITIHKHYYQQKPIAPPHSHHHRHHSPPPAKPKGPPPLHQHHSHRLGNRHHHHPRQIKTFNPLLPDVREKLKKDTHFIPDFKGYKEPFELI